MSQPQPGAGDPSNNQADDQTGRFVTQPNGPSRPLTPRMKVWSWNVSMLA